MKSKNLIKLKNTPNFIHEGVVKRKLNGYVFIKIGTQFIPEHRLVAEEFLKRQLNPEETVHHLDHDRTNNKPENLMLFENQKSHKSFENKESQFGKTRYVIEEINKRKITNIK